MRTAHEEYIRLADDLHAGRERRRSRDDGAPSVKALTEEPVGNNPYDLTYTYDVDMAKRPFWIEEPGHRAKRPLTYDVVKTRTSVQVSRMKYDYALLGHAVGSVAQIRHLHRTDEMITSETKVRPTMRWGRPSITTRWVSLGSSPSANGWRRTGRRPKSD